MSIISALHGGSGLALMLLLVCCGAPGSVESLESEAEFGKNPLRKVITLLQNLKKEVEAEGEKHKEMYEKYMCYCETNEAATSKNLEDEKAHLGKLESAIKEYEGSNAQLTADIAELQEELEEDTKGMEKATGVRKSEATSYAAESNDMKVSIQSLDKAIPAIKKGMEGGAAAALLQPARGALLQSLKTNPSPDTERDDGARDALLALLQGRDAPAGGTGAILGTMEQMRANFKENLEKATKEEEDAIKAFDELVAGKSKEIKAAKAEIEEKKSRVSKQEQLKSDAEEDMEDTKAAIKKDEDFLIGLKRACGQRTKEFEAAEVQRQQEIKAVQETIGILNDDDALEVAKKTLPSSAAAGASFVQLGMRVSESSQAQARVHAAAAILRSSGQLGLALLAEHTSAGSRTGSQADKFAKLKGMINEMISDLQKEQADDDEKLEWCKQELDANEDARKEVQTGLDGHNSKVARLKTAVKALLEGIKTLNSEVQSLKVAQLVAEQQRKEEKGQYTKEMSELNVASSLLKKAKDRLTQMYNPPTEKKKEEAFAQQLGRDSEAEGMLGLSFMQTKDGIDAYLQEDSSKSATTVGIVTGVWQAQPKTQGGMAIIGMIDKLRKEIALEIQEAEMIEKQSQKDFDELTVENAASVKAKKKDILAMEAVLSRNEEDIVTEKKARDEEQDDMFAVMSKLQALQQSCNFLMQNYDERKKARSSELEGMQKSIAILSGADFGGDDGGAAAASFLQRAEEIWRPQLRKKASSKFLHS